MGEEIGHDHATPDQAHGANGVARHSMDRRREDGDSRTGRDHGSHRLRAGRLLNDAGTESRRATEIVNLGGEAGRRLRGDRDHRLASERLQGDPPLAGEAMFARYEQCQRLLPPGNQGQAARARARRHADESSIQPSFADRPQQLGGGAVLQRELDVGMSRAKAAKQIRQLGAEE